MLYSTVLFYISRKCYFNPVEGRPESGWAWHSWFLGPGLAADLELLADYTKQFID